METVVPIAGQRWVSDSEPELGLGIIVSSDSGRVEILFSAAQERRQYALESAPLRRVHFKIGDRIRTRGGKDLHVEDVEEKNGLLAYKAVGLTVQEAELADSISFSKPEERFLGGQIDDPELFDLRVEALHWRSRIRKSPVRGFIGGRVDLIPHQLYISSEVASRLNPRVLLADEVGLGKTIEACLILHRLYLTGRAERILILVPESLIHQWFVELLRRFNLLFNLFDEERCESIQGEDPQTNPFLDSQLILCSIEFLVADPRRSREVTEAGWDLLVIDEAHHLMWSPAEASAEYLLADELASGTPSLLLLTATPQQLGMEGHFARLRLLDPDRYSNFEAFIAESRQYIEVATAVDRLIDGAPLDSADRDLFAARSPRIHRDYDALMAGDESARIRLIGELLDAFGTGRVMFRNTRTALPGFPIRHVHLYPIERSESADSDAIVHAYGRWLANLLNDLGKEKVLLICKTSDLVREIEASLEREISVKCGQFHDEMNLMQRDRTAAWFAEEDGARILLCSEIGSEGRNFQFVHHLVCLDLPDDPELLEQRIGRLDRIGQNEAIHIHIPYVPGGASEVMARWYHEGLNAFEENLHGATEIALNLKADLDELRQTFDTVALDRFVARTAKRKSQITRRLERGHDRLLELNSSNPERAEEIIERIRARDADREFEDFILSLVDHFGLRREEHSERTFVLKHGDLVTEDLPGLPEEGMTLTLDRRIALRREDIHFLNGDHPLVRGALDILLSSERGNTAFSTWPRSGEEGLILELLSVAECVAPPVLHVDRFLPATAIRTVVDHDLNDLSDDAELLSAPLQRGDPDPLISRNSFRRNVLPRMLKSAFGLAEERMHALVREARSCGEKHYQNEIDRLVDLKEVNDHVREEEIQALVDEKVALAGALNSTHLRSDALRFIWKIES